MTKYTGLIGRPGRAVILVLCSFLMVGFLTVSPASAKSKKKLDQKAFPQVKLFDDSSLHQIGLKALWKLPIPNKSFRAIYKVGRHLLAESTAAELYAIDEKQGIVRWKVCLPGSCQFAPRVWNGTLFIVANQKLIGVHEKYGALEWVKKLDSGPIAPPCISGGAIHIPCGDNRIYMFDAFKLRYIGRYRFATSLPCTAVHCAGKGAIAVFGSTDDRLYAYTISENKPMWVRQFPAQLSVGMGQKGNLVYVGCANFLVYAVDVRSGMTKWAETAEDMVCKHPVVLDDTVFATTIDKRTVAFDADTGKKRWSCKCAIQVLALDKRNDVLFLLGKKDEILALKPKTGMPIGRAKASENLLATINYDSPVAYLGSVDGQFVAIVKDTSPLAKKD